MRTSVRNYHPTGSASIGFKQACYCQSLENLFRTSWGAHGLQLGKRDRRSEACLRGVSAGCDSPYITCLLPAEMRSLTIGLEPYTKNYMRYCQSTGCQGATMGGHGGPLSSIVSNALLTRNPRIKSHGA